MPVPVNAPQSRAPARPAKPASAAAHARTSPKLRGRGRGGKPAAELQPSFVARLGGALGKWGKGLISGKPAKSAARSHRRVAVDARTEEAERKEAAAAKATGRAPVTPAQDPAFQTVKTEVRRDARRQRWHAPASAKRDEASEASALPKTEQVDQSSKEKTTDEMERVGGAQREAGKNFSAESFKSDLKQRINSKRPTTEDQAKSFAANPPIEHFEDKFAGDVAKKQGEVTGPLEKKAIEPPSGGVAEKPDNIEVPHPRFAAAPKPPAPDLAAPKPKTDSEISHQGDIDKLDDEMRKNRLSDDQLAESREPSFLETLKVKQEAQRRAAQAPSVYRAREASILQTAQAKAGQHLAAGLSVMNRVQRGTGVQVYAGQKSTETQTEKRQKEIKKTIDGIYQDTVIAVKGILDAMTKQVKDDFARTLKEKTDGFNAEVTRRISDYYGDWRIDDELFGPDDVVVLEDGSTRAMTIQERFGQADTPRINPDVYQIFVEEKNAFVRAMDGALDGIAKNVETGLNAAQNRIRFGETMFQVFKAGLKGEELGYAQHLEEEVTQKFHNLEGSIDDAREDLLQTLADQYKESVDQLQKSFNEINDDLKKSWLDRAADFIKTVGKTIFQLADLLLTILMRMAHLVWDIVKHPIRFFETLISGLGQAIGDFVSNIGTYMQEAFWTWITGAAATKAIRLTAGSGVEVLFSVVLQVLSLTREDLRAIAEKILGREFMQMFDKGVEAAGKVLEPLVILLTKGPLALWQYIKDTLGDIVKSAFDRIKESVFYTFVEKAIKWIAGFFVPGGGFVKVVKAIFKAFQFVVENLDRIRTFFDSVFDSLEAATRGDSGGVAAKIITGLKMGIVLALDFLAKQLGLEKIVDGVHKVIQSLRRPIVSAVEWVLGKLKAFAQGVVHAAASAGRAVVRGAKAVAGWAFASASFRESDGQTHSIYFEGEESPRLMIASNVMAASAFLDWYTEEHKSDAFTQKHGKLIAKIRDAIKDAQSTAKQIADLRRGGKAWKERQQELLEKNVALSRLLSELVGKDPTIAKELEKYKLEGLTGTYGSMPKPKGDEFTPDHQPQAAVLTAAAKFRFFSPTGELAERAEGRAQEGFAINLYRVRHALGATYGKKGGETKDAFLERVKPLVKNHPAQEQRRLVIDEIRKDLRRDVVAMKLVVRDKYDTPTWADVIKIAGPKDGPKVVGEIRQRVNSGEDQIANQDLDSLVS